MIAYIASEIALYIDNTVQVQASMMKLAERVRYIVSVSQLKSERSLLAKQICKWLKNGQVRSLFKRDQVQADCLERNLRDLNDPSITDAERNDVYLWLADHYLSKLDEGNDMSSYFDAKFHEQFPLPC